MESEEYRTGKDTGTVGTGEEAGSMVKIDLNCDLGESFGAYTIGMDDKVIPLISS